MANTNETKVICSGNGAANIGGSLPHQLCETITPSAHFSIICGVNTLCTIVIILPMAIEHRPDSIVARKIEPYRMEHGLIEHTPIVVEWITDSSAIV